MCALQTSALSGCDNLRVRVDGEHKGKRTLSLTSSLVTNCMSNSPMFLSIDGGGPRTRGRFYTEGGADFRMDQKPFYSNETN